MSLPFIFYEFFDLVIYFYLQTLTVFKTEQTLIPIIGILWI